MVKKLSFATLALGVFSAAILIMPNLGHAQTASVCGDLNNDYLLTPSDVVLEQNYVFLGQMPSSTPDAFWRADVNGDGILTSTDAVRLLNAVYLGQPLSCAPHNRPPIINYFTRGSTSTIPAGFPETWYARATDPEGQMLFYTVTWGNFASSTYANASSGLAVTFNHTFNIPGTYYQRLVVNDPYGGVASTTTSVTVTSSSPSIPVAPGVPIISNDVTIKSLQDTIALLTKQLTSLISQVNALNAGRVQMESPSISTPLDSSDAASKNYVCLRACVNEKNRRLALCNGSPNPNDRSQCWEVALNAFDRCVSSCSNGSPVPVTAGGGKSSLFDSGFTPTPSAPSGALVPLPKAVDSGVGSSMPSNQPPTISRFYGESQVVASTTHFWNFLATDAESFRLGFSIQWGDGSIREGIASSGIIAAVSHRYFLPGSYSPLLTVSDFSGGIVQSSTFVQVLSAVPNQPPTAFISGSSTVISGVPGTWFFRGVDPEGGILNYTVYWNDDTLPAQGSVASGNWFSLGHTYRVASTTTSIHMTVTDAGGLTGFSSLPITILPGTVPPAPQPIKNVGVDVGASVLNSFQFQLNSIRDQLQAILQILGSSR